MPPGQVAGKRDCHSSVFVSGAGSNSAVPCAMAYIAVPLLLVVLALVPEGRYVAVAKRLSPIWQRFQAHVAQ